MHFCEIKSTSFFEISKYSNDAFSMFSSLSILINFAFVLTFLGWNRISRVTSFGIFIFLGNIILIPFAEIS